MEARHPRVGGDRLELEDAWSMKILAALFVMAPHREYTNDSLGFENFVDKAMLEVDSPGVTTIKITDELLVWRRIAEWIVRQDVE